MRFHGPIIARPSAKKKYSLKLSKKTTKDVSKMMVYMMYKKKTEKITKIKNDY